MLKKTEGEIEYDEETEKQKGTVSEKISLGVTVCFDSFHKLFNIKN